MTVNESDSVAGISPGSEAFVRSRVTVIVMSSIAAGRAARSEPTTGPNYRTCFSRPLIGFFLGSVRLTGEA